MARSYNGVANSMTGRHTLGARAMPVFVGVARFHLLVVRGA